MLDYVAFDMGIKDLGVHLYDFKIKDAFNELDEDGDGFITKQQFLIMVKEDNLSSNLQDLRNGIEKATLKVLTPICCYITLFFQT